MRRIKEVCPPSRLPQRKDSTKSQLLSEYGAKPEPLDRFEYSLVACVNVLIS